MHGHRSPSPIYLAAMPDFNNEDHEPLIGHRIDHSIIPHAQAINLMAAQLHSAGRARLNPKQFDFLDDSTMGFRRQLPECPQHCRHIFDSI
jgi:hypothetical protein